MGRIALALSVAVSIWLGSALAAEAQNISTTGPMSVVAGSPGTTVTGNVLLVTLCPFRLKVQVLRGTQEIHNSETVCPKPGTLLSTVSKYADFWYPVYSGDVLTFLTSIKVGTVWYPAGLPWTVTVTATRPSKTDSYQKRSILAVQAVDRDRRRE